MAKARRKAGELTRLSARALRGRHEVSFSEGGCGLNAR